MISFDVISYQMIRYHIIWYHMISYDIISYDIISYHMISYDMISYDIRPRPRPRPQPLFTLEIWNFFRKMYMEKWTLKNQKYAKKIRAEILYIFHIGSLQDDFSRANVGYFVFSAWNTKLYNCYIIYKEITHWGYIFPLLFRETLKQNNFPNWE